MNRILLFQTNTLLVG